MTEHKQTTDSMKLYVLIPDRFDGILDTFAMHNAIYNYTNERLSCSHVKMWVHFPQTLEIPNYS